MKVFGAVYGKNITIYSNAVYTIGLQNGTGTTGTYGSGGYSPNCGQIIAAGALSLPSSPTIILDATNINFNSMVPPLVYDLIVAGSAFTVPAISWVNGSPPSTVSANLSTITGAGSSQILRLSISDIANPQLHVSNFPARYINQNSFTIQGTLADPSPSSGLASLQYSTNQGTSWSNLTVSSNWNLGLTGLQACRMVVLISTDLKRLTILAM